ncbi:MAG: nucleoside kinase [Halanaerobiales bacterium]|nr:nucleoside kinase [Halanaerobiales bacterium]
MPTVKYKDYEYEVSSGTKVLDFIDEINLKDKEKIIGVKIDNELLNLHQKINSNCEINFVTLESRAGNRLYKRSLFMLMAKAVYEIYGDEILNIEHSLSNGIYCELSDNKVLSKDELQTIIDKMKEIVKKDYPIKSMVVSREKGLKILKEQGNIEKVRIIEQKNIENVILYELDGYYNYYYYPLVPSTGHLDKFHLHYHFPGFVMLYPYAHEPYEVRDFIEQPKLADIFYDYEKLGDILNVGFVPDLNEQIEKNDFGELIRISEGLHEKGIANIADQIASHKEMKRIILIAGPSSSGKTTFTKRLSTQLRINGLKPVSISTDDYFVNRDKTPIDEDGNFDFESLKAINLELFNDHLVKLMRGEEVRLPVFNFKKGIREDSDTVLKLKSDQPILIEGIHSLNNKLTEFIPDDHKYKIFISALTQLNIDKQNRIPTSDTRLFRRIVRDNLYRGHTANDTLEMWERVRKGEEENIYPYQENADVMFNSALIYELSVLKNCALPLLKEIDKDNFYYYEAQRLLEVLYCFKTMPFEDIPKTSILREFIGGSVYRKK